MRRTELRRGKPLRRRSPLRKLSRKRQDRVVAAIAPRVKAHERDNWTCQGPARGLPGDCWPSPFVIEAHHVLPRSAGGPDTVENLISLCPRCHRYVHEHPALAYELELLKRRNAA